MFKLGYAIIDFPYQTTEVFNACREYFAQESAVKECDKKALPEHGYHVNDRRECYVVRNGQNPSVLASAYPIFKQIHKLGIEILGQVEKDLQMTPGTLTDMVQRCVKSDRTNVSLLRLFQYSNTPTEDCVSALAHEDIGMISIIPRSTEPALEIFDHKLLDWVKVEQLLKPHQALVLVGETLAKASLGKYQAALHQVVWTAPFRCSLVYHMRANLDAVLDSSRLKTARIRPFRPSFQITVGDFLKSEQKQRRSINGAF